jgi:hypothetical protein
MTELRNFKEIGSSVEEAVDVGRTVRGNASVY